MGTTFLCLWTGKPNQRQIQIQLQIQLKFTRLALTQKCSTAKVLKCEELVSVPLLYSRDFSLMPVMEIEERKEAANEEERHARNRF